MPGSERDSALASSAEALLQLASDFSPRYEMVRPHLVVVDIGGLDRLFGTPHEVGEAFCRLARDRGLTVAVGIASTQTAALLLALHQATAGQVGVAPAAALTAPIASAAAVEPAKLADAETHAHAHAKSHAGIYADRLTVVRLGREAAALAPLPLLLLSALPSDRLTNDDVAFLRRRPDPARPESTASSASSQSVLKSRASDAANMPDADNGVALGKTRGRTRGKTGRGGARNYRLAPSPSQAQEAERSDEAVLDVLRRWGLKTLGEFAALPADALFERLGREGLELQEVARGRDARPLVPTIAGEPFEASLALEWPIEELEPLSFVLTRLFEPLCARLERCDRGAAVLHVSLQLVSRERHTRRLELPAPMRDAKVLRTLVLLDLESHPPGAGIDRVTLTIEPTPGRIIQHSLLARPLPSAEQLSTLTARLTAVMGDNRVGASVLVDTHRPEAFTMRRFHVTDDHPRRDARNARHMRDIHARNASPHHAHNSGGTPASGLAPTLDEVRRIYLLAGKLADPLTRAEAGADAPGFVLRRFRRPIPARVRVEHDRPVHVAPQGLPGGAVIQAAGPWRTSGEWWKSRPRLHPANAPEASSGASPDPSVRAPTPTPARRRRATKPWNRDEWDVALTDGTLYRIHLDHGQNRWYVEASLD